VEVAVFEIQYAVTSNLRGMVRTGEIFPLKIKGDAKQLYYWDVSRGRPYSYQDEFDYVYLLANGE
jgi:hypothetical protein